MSFLVTARKYRPAVFGDVVAQGHVVSTLLNAMRTGRVAHAYLFTGPRGVGKTTTARILAKALNCPDAADGEPCNVCDSCREITEGRSMDIIEIDAASNTGVDDVRTVRDAVRYVPTRGRYKMYIVDEVHMLSKNAFNALLKTLEEPPEHALFILATTEPHKVPATIISRCQRYDFRRIAADDIVAQLRRICAREGITAEDKALFAIAKRGDGSMRDAESIFDQVAAFAGTELTHETVRQVLNVVDIDLYFRFTDLILTNNTAGGFALADEIVMSGYDFQDVLAGLEEHFRNLLVARTTGGTRLIEAPEDVRAHCLTQAAEFSEGDLLRLLKLAADAAQAVRTSTQPRLRFELALIAMIKIDSTVEISALLAGAAPAARPAPGAHGAARVERGPSLPPPPPAPGSPAASATGGGAPVRAVAKLPAEPPLSAAHDVADLRAVEDAYRTALRGSAPGGMPSGLPPSAETPPRAVPPVSGPAPASPPVPHPAIVQMLIDGLGAALLPDQR